MNKDLEAAQDGSDTFISIRVTPKASRSAIGAIHDGRLKISVTAAPVDGAANGAVQRLIGKTLGISKSRVSVVAGLQSRNKRLRVEDMNAELVVRGLMSSR